MATEVKKHYYVSVSGKSIEARPSMGEQLEVMATDAQIRKLELVLHRQHEDDEQTQLKAPIPYKSSDHDEATEKYSEDLIGVYRKIYELGTERTREHIRTMRIIRELHDTDYDHPGYNNK